MKTRARATFLASTLLILISQLIWVAKATDYNRCLQFDGTNYMEASRNLIPVTGDYTIEMMVYPSIKNENRYAHFISQGAQPAPIYLGTDPNGKLRAGDTWINTGYSMPNSRWVHVALVHYSNNSGFLYIDGNFVKSNTQYYDTSKPGTFTRLGSQFFGSGGEFFVGCIDNLRIWNTVRTAEQIKNNWNLPTPVNRYGLLANYTFDNYYGFTDRIRTVNSDNSDPAYSFTYKNNPVSLPETGSFKSTGNTSNCHYNYTNNYLNSNIPKIDQFIARNKFVTVLQLDTTSIPDGSCIGIDVFIRGSNVPISSSVAIKSNDRDLFYIDTALFECHTNEVNRIVMRPWSSNQNRQTVYGDPVQVPGCAGEIPGSNSSAMPFNQTYSLISPNPVYAATIERIKASKLTMPTSNILGTAQRVYEISGCHAKVSTAYLQRAENGMWVDSKPADGWEQKTFCDSAHPFQPYVDINYPEGTIVRWRISDGANWEVYSPPSVFKPNLAVQSIGSTPQTNASSTSSPVAQNLPTATPSASTIAIPFAFSPSIKNNNVIINVAFDRIIEKGTVIELISSALGYSKNKPLVGIGSGKKGSFTIPKTKFSKLKIDPSIEVRSKNKNESSETLKGKVPLNSLKLGTISKATKATSAPKPVAAPKQTQPVTQAIKCFKGNLARTFLSDACPPGWSAKN